MKNSIDAIQEKKYNKNNQLKILVNKEKEKIQISISVTGIGIKESNMEKIL